MPHVVLPSSGTTSGLVRNHRRRPLVLLIVAALGFAASVGQLALVRELLGVMSGNELTIGVALGCWLMLTALGTWLGVFIRHPTHPVQLLARLTAVVALLPMIEVLALRALPGTAFLRGASIDPIATILTSLVVLAPFCLGSGAILAFACRTLAREDNGAAIRRVYWADCVGSVIGAVVFTFGLAPRFDHAAILCWPPFIAFTLAAWVGWRRGAPGLTTTGTIGAITMLVLAAVGQLDTRSTQWQHLGTVVHRVSSPYGRLVVTSNSGQLTFFENGIPIVYAANTITIEEIAHFALAQRPHSRSVLLIGGVASGVARQILRYPAVRQVTCVELDPELIAAGRQFLPQNFVDPRIRIVPGDGRRFVQHTRERFDAILVALPDPTTFQLNRYYSAEFFAEAHRVLTPGGIFATAIGRYESYLSRESTQLLASTRRTLATTFPNVIAIPGQRVFFLGSDQALRRDIGAVIEAQDVKPELVNPHYLDAMLTPDRMAELDRATATPALINRDFHPVLYLLQLRFWLAQFKFPGVGLMIGLGVVVLVGLAQSGAVPRMLFAAGFAASALEITSLVAIQVYYGALYRQIGMIVAVFMLGLTIGSWAAGRRTVPSVRAAVRVLSATIAALAITSAILLPWLGFIDRVGVPWAGQMVVILLTFATAAVVGAQFSLAAITATSSPRTAPRLFTADLAGAAVAAVAVSTFMLPWLGLPAVCLATAGLNLVAAALASSNHGHA